MNAFQKVNSYTVILHEIGFIGIVWNVLVKVPLNLRKKDEDPLYPLNYLYFNGK